LLLGRLIARIFLSLIWQQSGQSDYFWKWKQRLNVSSAWTLMQKMS
jgi:hypothetical protein